MGSVDEIRRPSIPSCSSRTTKEGLHKSAVASGKPHVVGTRHAVSRSANVTGLDYIISIVDDNPATDDAWTLGLDLSPADHKFMEFSLDVINRIDDANFPRISLPHDSAFAEAAAIKSFI